MVFSNLQPVANNNNNNNNTIDTGILKILNEKREKSSPGEHPPDHQRTGPTQSGSVSDANYDPLTSPAPVHIVWMNVFSFSLVHFFALGGIWMICTGQIMWKSILWMILVVQMDEVGVTAGAHRLWSHRSYKAKNPLKILLILMQTMSGQFSVYEWCRDHRVHHKFSDTNADPYNASRGFFFSHMGWFLTRKHPEVIIKGKQNDISDLQADPIVMLQQKFYYPLSFFLVFVFPTLVAYFGWGESFWGSFLGVSNLAYCSNLHCASLVNSAAHMFGTTPYDKNIKPRENYLVALLSSGEGWHNYHHTFPWDYKASEFSFYNPTTSFINFMAAIGQAYDLKNVSSQLLEARIKRTGALSSSTMTTTEGDQVIVQKEDSLLDKENQNNNNNNNSSSMGRNFMKNLTELKKNYLLRIGEGPWGWGDEDIPHEDLKITETLYKSI